METCQRSRLFLDFYIFYLRQMGVSENGIYHEIATELITYDILWHLMTSYDDLNNF